MESLSREHLVELTHFAKYCLRQMKLFPELWLISVLVFSVKIWIPGWWWAHTQLCLFTAGYHFSSGCFWLQVTDIVTCRIISRDHGLLLSEQELLSWVLCPQGPRCFPVLSPLMATEWLQQLQAQHKETKSPSKGRHVLPHMFLPIFLERKCFAGAPPSLLHILVEVFLSGLSG